MKTEAPRELRVVDTLASVVSVCYVALGVCLFASGLSTFLLVGRQTNGTLDETDTDTLAWIAVAGWSSFTYAVVLFPAAILFLYFVYFACANARAMERPDMDVTPGWAVGWFFIPVASLFKPYQALKEIHRASDPEAGAESWKLFAVPGYFPLWWAGWIGYNLAGVPVRLLARVSGEDAPAVNGYVVARAMIGCLAAICLVLVVDGIRRLQKERAEQLYGPRPR